MNKEIEAVFNLALEGYALEIIAQVKVLGDKAIAHLAASSLESDRRIATDMRWWTDYLDGMTRYSDATNGFQVIRLIKRYLTRMTVSTTFECVTCGKEITEVCGPGDGICDDCRATMKKHSSQCESCGHIHSLRCFDCEPVPVRLDPREILSQFAAAANHAPEHCPKCNSTDTDHSHRNTHGYCFKCSYEWELEPIDTETEDIPF